MKAAEPRSKRQAVEFLEPAALRRGAARGPVEIVSHEASRQALQCRRKFLRYFRKGFDDPKYHHWERDYKIQAHDRWHEVLNPHQFRELLAKEEFAKVAEEAVRIESRTNLLFSFEKMALRDAVKSAEGAELFASGLFDWLYGRASREERFQNWVEAIEALPRKKTRVLTWPLVTVFGFIAEPDREIFLKPMVTRRAAQAYGFHFDYRSRPNWETYASLLKFADTISTDLADLAPQDMIDLQSFIWVQGSDEYD